jgi:hypothetical protein
MFIRVKEAKEKVSPYFIKESGKNRGECQCIKPRDLAEFSTLTLIGYLTRLDRVEKNQ